jgi:hypothetical protein
VSRVFTVTHGSFSNSVGTVRDKLMICVAPSETDDPASYVRCRFMRVFQDVPYDEVVVTEGLDLWATDFQKITHEAQQVLFDLAKRDGEGYDAFEYFVSLSYTVTEK